MTTDAKDTKTDAVPGKGGDSEDQGRKDSAQPKIYTEDEAEKKFSSQRSVLDTKVTTLEKKLEVANKKTEDAEAKEVERQRERDEAAVRDADGDPVKLTFLQSKKAFREEQATHKKAVAAEDKRQSAFQERIEKVEAAELKTSIKAIAEKHKVDLKALTDLNITDLKVIEATAKAMANAKPFNPDLGDSVGGVSLTEQQRLEKLYPSMKKS